MAAAGHSDDRRLAALKSAWRGLDSGTSWIIQVANTETGQTFHGTDREIAKDWLYADLIHADTDRRERLALVRQEDRYMCGLLWVVDSIILIGATQNVITTLVKEGVIDLEAA